MYKLIRIVAGLILIAIYSGCDPRDRSLSDNVVCPGGVVADWDNDGDGISNSIENNNSSEGYHPELHSDTTCNTDLSCAGGSWNDAAGCIDSAYNLTDQGTGYIHYNPDGKDVDDWGTLDLINVIEAAARELGTSPPLIQVGDLSLRHGGPFPGHGSHRNGLDVDIRYVRKDGKHTPLDIFTSPQDYDSAATMKMMGAIITAAENTYNIDVVWIFVDLTSLKFVDSDLKSIVGFPGVWLNDTPDHANHFHLRLEDKYSNVCDCE